MKALHTAIACIFIAFSGSSCYAGASKSGFDFSSPPLGASRHLLPKGIRPGENCSIELSFVDCKYTSKSGILYTVYGSVITKKEIVFNNSSYVPFGLDNDDKINDVVQKLSSRGLIFNTGMRDGVPRLVSRPMRNSLGTTYQLYVDFEPNGHWKIIAVTAAE